MKLVAFVLGALLMNAAEPEEEVWRVVSDMAASLSEPNPVAFMKAVSKTFPRYEYLEREVRGLCQANEVTSSITPFSNTGDGEKRILELDWYLEIHSQGDSSKATQRRQTITVQLVKIGKRWQITSITPVEFFAHTTT